MTLSIIGIENKVRRVGTFICFIGENNKKAAANLNLSMCSNGDKFSFMAIRMFDIRQKNLKSEFILIVLRYKFNFEVFCWNHN